jgi:hypothetical protein
MHSLLVAYHVAALCSEYLGEASGRWNFSTTGNCVRSLAPHSTQAKYQASSDSPSIQIIGSHLMVNINQVESSLRNISPGALFRLEARNSYQEIPEIGIRTFLEEENGNAAYRTE